MLKKRDRLTTKDIETLSQGKSVFGTLISLRFFPAKQTKVSVTVSKKFAVKAVDRNRIRRRVYEAVGKCLPKIKNPVFVLVMPKKDCLTVPFEQLCIDVDSLFAKAGFFR